MKKRSISMQRWLAIGLLFFPLSALAEKVPLNFEMLAKQQKYTHVAQMSPPEFFNPPAAVEIAPNQFVLVSVQCENVCFPYVALLSGSPSSYKVTHLQRLPSLPKGHPDLRAGMGPGSSPHYKILPTLVMDLIGDGKKEIVARVSFVTAPRPVLGVQFYETLTVLNLEDLSVALSLESEISGNGPLDPVCTSQFFKEPKDQSVRVVKSCTTHRCIDFPDEKQYQCTPTSTSSTYYWDAAKRIFGTSKPKETMVPVSSPSQPTPSVTQSPTQPTTHQEHAVLWKRVLVYAIPILLALVLLLLFLRRKPPQ